MAKSGTLGSESKDELRIVMGNTSCDMDSVVGAITLAYYYTKKTGNTFVPVINCRKDEFMYRLEIALHMKDCEISPEHLFFYDTFRELYKPEQVTEVALVDHNILDVTQADLGSKVTRVIDHHVDANAYSDQLVEKAVCLVGSACSLVACKYAEDEELFKDDLAVDRDGRPNLAHLMGAAVVLDSYNFREELKDRKWNQLDLNAHTFLSQTADLGFDYWARLNGAKFDVEGGLRLGLRGVFVRDYKCYDLPAGLMGVAVTTSSVKKLIDYFGREAFGKAIEDLTTERKLGLFCIVHIGNDNSGALKKGIMVHHSQSSTSELAGKYQSLLSLIEGTADMQLSNKQEVDFENTGNNATFYDIGNTRYSRKAFEAIVKNNEF